MKKNIINLPADFLEAEERCNYSVSSKMKEVWAVELDLLSELDRVCHKYGITYYAFAGTLLGAARHKGFIPWDDDIDVMMLWDEYKKFMHIAPNEIKHPYFFQCHRTDEFAEASHARIRNSETTGCTKWEYENVKSKNYNRGIFIDIFPFFPIPLRKESRDKQKNEIERIWRAIRGWNAVQNHKVGILSKYDQYIPYWEEQSKTYTIVQTKDKYLEACAMCDEESDEIGATSYRTYSSRFIYKREWFDSMVFLPFENTSVVCPKRVDEILTKTYGDWQVPEYNGANHEMFIFDTRTSYLHRKDLFI